MIRTRLRRSRTISASVLSGHSLTISDFTAVRCLVILALAGVAFAAEEVSPVAPGAGLVVVYSDKAFFECPVWDYAHGALYFDSYQKKVDRLVRLEADGSVTPQEGTEGVGGAFLARDGRILAADCAKHRILSFAAGPDGLSDPKVMAEDPAWHQPNDICEAPSGHIYFTDPDFSEKKSGSVFHLFPSGKVSRAVSHLPCPNGVTASGDGKTLYVSDTSLREWWAFPILADGGLGEGRVFFKPESDARAGGPDGMTSDEFGNLYLTGMGGVWIVSPTGRQLDFIPVPEFCSNVRIGGPDRKTLYITCSKKVYSLSLKARAGWPHPG